MSTTRKTPYHSTGTCAKCGAERVKARHYGSCMGVLSTNAITTWQHGDAASIWSCRECRKHFVSPHLAMKHVWIAHLAGETAEPVPAPVPTTVIDAFPESNGEITADDMVAAFERRIMGIDAEIKNAVTAATSGIAARLEVAVGIAAVMDDNLAARWTEIKLLQEEIETLRAAAANNPVGAVHVKSLREKLFQR
jgi:hypothetical protein